MAIAALFQEKIQEAEDLWEQGLERFPDHFDLKVNYEMYRWKYAVITDDDLIAELEE